MPKLRKLPFETAIIERYRRRESSVEEALIEMLPRRRLGAASGGHHGGTVGHQGEPRHGEQPQQEDLRPHRALAEPPDRGYPPYVYLDGIVLKRTWAGEVRNVSVLVAIGVSREGFRDILGVAEGAKEDKAGWLGFLRHLKERGLTGVEPADQRRLPRGWSRLPASSTRTPSGSGAPRLIPAPLRRSGPFGATREKGRRSQSTDGPTFQPQPTRNRAPTEPRPGCRRGRW
jgi:hypothetical protein